jgi:hypothetical protein
VAYSIQAIDLAHRVGESLELWPFYLTAIVPHLRGDWQAARDMYDRGLEVAPTWFLLLGFRAQLEYDVGNFSAGQVYLGLQPQLAENLR